MDATTSNETVSPTPVVISSVMTNPAFTEQVASLSGRQIETVDLFLTEAKLNPATVTVDVVERTLGTSNLNYVIERGIRERRNQRNNNLRSQDVTDNQIEGARWRLSLAIANHRDMRPSLTEALQTLAYESYSIDNALTASRMLDGFDAYAARLGQPVTRRERQADTNPSLTDAPVAEGSDSEPF